MDKRKEDSPLINFTLVAVNIAADWSKTVRKIDKSIKRIESYQSFGDGRLHVSCYAEPNKLMTCLQKERKRARLVRWQYEEARTDGYPSTVNFTLNVGVDKKDWIMSEKLTKIIVQGPHGFQVLKTDKGWDISGCSEPNTLLNFLQEAGNTVHLVHWRECATNFRQNSCYHQVGRSDYKDKAPRVENPSFVNYSDNKSNGYNANSQPCATYIQSSTPRGKPYANKTGICSCCIM